MTRRKRSGPLANFAFCLLILILLPLIILALPVILPVVALLERRDLNRRQRVARQFACVQCGALLGTAALDRADAAWAEEWVERRRQHPHVRWRVVRRIWAICGRCGANYGFKDGTFNPISPGSASAEPAAEPGPVPPAPLG